MTKPERTLSNFIVCHIGFALILNLQFSSQSSTQSSSRKVGCKQITETLNKSLNYFFSSDLTLTSDFFKFKLTDLYKQQYEPKYILLHLN